MLSSATDVSPSPTPLTDKRAYIIPFNLRNSPMPNRLIIRSGQKPISSPAHAAMQQPGLAGKPGRG
jgi:hypothetical protein